MIVSREPPPLLHPNMAVLYRERISALHERLQAEATRPEAAELVRSLVDQITLVPEDGALSIVLRGDLAALLSFASRALFRGSLPKALKATVVVRTENRVPDLFRGGWTYNLLICSAAHPDVKLC